MPLFRELAVFDCLPLHGDRFPRNLYEFSPLAYWWTARRNMLLGKRSGEVTPISYEEHYNGAYGRYVRERRLAGSLPLSMFEALQPAGEFPDPPVSDLVILEIRTSIKGRWDFGAGRIHAAEAGLVNVIPPLCPTQIEVDRPHMFRAFYLPEAQARIRIEDCCGGNLPDLSRLQHSGTRDPLIVNLLARLWASGADDADLGRFFADSAVLTLLAELIREAGQTIKLAKGGLSPLQLRRAKDFVEASIDQDIGLVDVAEEVGLSAYHFARAFKQTTGLSPVQYLVKRRIAHAQMLLQLTDSPLVDIALACGFGSQSSFTTAFNREVGLTPARWRRAAATQRRSQGADEGRPRQTTAFR
jgi:AraC family transcriptional regulator